MSHATDTLRDRCERCDAEPAIGAPNAAALLGEMRAQLERLRLERDAALGVVRERDALRLVVTQYRAQHDREAQRHGCPFCTCPSCAAAMSVRVA